MLGSHTLKTKNRNDAFCSSLSFFLWFHFVSFQNPILISLLLSSFTYYPSHLFPVICCVTYNKKIVSFDFIQGFRCLVKSFVDYSKTILFLLRRGELIWKVCWNCYNMWWFLFVNKLKCICLIPSFQIIIIPKNETGKWLECDPKHQNKKSFPILIGPKYYMCDKWKLTQTRKVNIFVQMHTQMKMK